MNGNGNYPAGAELDSCAPWNECEKRIEKFERDFALCYTLTAEIESQDYDADDDFNYTGDAVADFEETYMGLAEAIKAVLPELEELYATTHKGFQYLQFRDAVRALRAYQHLELAEIDED